MGVLGLLPWGGAGWRKVPGIPPLPQMAREDGLAWDMTVTHRIATTLMRENHVKATGKLWGPLELHLVLTGKQQSGEQGCLWGSACP